MQRGNINRIYCLNTIKYFSDITHSSAMRCKSMHLICSTVHIAAHDYTLLATAKSLHLLYHSADVTEINVSPPILVPLISAH